MLQIEKELDTQLKHLSEKYNCVNTLRELKKGISEEVFKTFWLEIEVRMEGHKDLTSAYVKGILR